jgi:hypothetical protein
VRQRAIDGEFLVHVSRHSQPQSELLRHLSMLMRPNLLRALDEAMRGLIDSARSSGDGRGLSASAVSAAFETTLDAMHTKQIKAVKRQQKRRARSPTSADGGGAPLDGDPLGRMMGKEHLAVCAALSTRLALLGKKREALLSGKGDSAQKRQLERQMPYTTIVTLWPRVVART